MKLNRLFVLLVLAAAALPGTGCDRPSEGVDRLLTEGVFGDAIPVETLILEAQRYEERFAAPGVLEAEEEVTVSSEIADRIVAVEREIGDRLRRGDLLLRLDDRAVRARVAKIAAELERAKTQLEWARKDLDRQERLFRTEVAAERAMDEARRLVDMSEDEVVAKEAELELARVELDRCSIHSPIDGSVSRRFVSVGEYVTPGRELYDLVATDTVKLVFSVAERDVIGVRAGQELAVRIDAHGEHAFRGTIRAISPAGSDRTRTFRVELALRNGPERPLLPGMSGAADVIRATYENVYLIPESAILRDGSSSYVFVAAGQRAQRRDVSIRSQVGALAVVDADFDAADDCIILGQAAVHEGTPLRVRRRHETVPALDFD